MTAGGQVSVLNARAGAAANAASRTRFRVCTGVTRSASARLVAAAAVNPDADRTTASLPPTLLPDHTGRSGEAFYSAYV